jgi:hypothetical protein
MNNLLYWDKNPLKIKTINVNSGRSQTTVIINELSTPKFVLDAIRKAETAGAKAVSQPLKSYYGQHWRQKLAFAEDADEGSANVDGSGDFEGYSGCTDEHIGGGGSSQDIADTEDFGVTEADLVLGPKIAVARPKAPASRSTESVRLISPVAAWPEDSIMTIKEKITVWLGVPIFEQHLYWHVDGSIELPYAVWTEHGPVSINLRAKADHCRKPTEKSIILPINQELYEARATIKIECNDNWRLLGPSPSGRGRAPDKNTLMLIRLDDFFANSSTAANTNDRQQIEYYYYGLIVAYWPMLTKDAFVLYVTDRAAVSSSYPELDKPIDLLRDKYTRESRIISVNYRFLAKARHKINTQDSRKEKTAYDIRGLKTAIVAVLARVLPVGATNISIRNLFDFIRVSRCMPEAQAYVMHGLGRWHLNKSCVQARSQIRIWPADFRRGLTLAISLRKNDQDSFHQHDSNMVAEKEMARFIFVNIAENGTLLIKTTWLEEEERDFAEIIGVMQRFVGPIIDNINNSAGAPVLIQGRLPALTAHTITVVRVNAIILWSKFMNERDFKDFIASFDPAIRAGIIENRIIVSSNRINSKYDFVFKKGIHNYNAAAIENNLIGPLLALLQNQYTYMSNNSAAQRWRQFYNGRAMSISHRTSDVKIEISDINDAEFATFVDYMYTAITAFMCAARSSVGTTAIVPSKRIKKLKEVDPELYNLKKYGHKRAYSIICQGPKQPTIWTEDEVSRLKTADAAKLSKYWNFTTGREARYSCPNPKYPHFFFITGVHPKNYCLPCCRKRPKNIEDARLAAIASICAKKHLFNPETDFANVRDAARQRHIINYGRALDIDRVARLPKELTMHLFQEAESRIYVIKGVPQSLPSERETTGYGLLWAVAHALDIDISALARDTVAALRQHPRLLASVGGGGILERIFGQDTKLFYYFDKIFIKKDPITSKELQIAGWTSDDWTRLVLEVLVYRLNIFVIIFEDITALATSDDFGAIAVETSSKEAKFDILIDRRLPNIASSLAHLKIGSRIIYVVKKGPMYYPILHIDETTYYKNNKAINKTFAPTSNIFTIITAALAREASHIKRRPTYDQVSEFIKQSGNKYTIEQKFIDLLGRCFAITVSSANHKFIVPLWPDLYRSDKICLVFTGPEPPAQSTLAALTNFAALYNKWAPEPLVIGPVITDVCGQAYLQTSCGAAPIGPAKADRSTTFGHNVGEINKKMYRMKNNNSLYKSKWRDEVPKAIYDNYIYDVFAATFIRHITNNNTDGAAMRSKIKKLLCGSKRGRAEIIEDISALVDTSSTDGGAHLPKEDADIIVNYIRAKDNTAADLVSLLDNNKWAFDNRQWHQLINFAAESSKIDAESSSKKEEVLSKIRAIAEEFCVVGDKANASTNGPLEKPQHIVPCGIENANLASSQTNNTVFCHGPKLVIKDETTMKDLVDIFAADISQPLKARIMKSSSALFGRHTIDFFHFKPTPLERIIVREAPTV